MAVRMNEPVVVYIFTNVLGNLFCCASVEDTTFVVCDVVGKTFEVV
jgi:hypothetical protein